MKDTEYIVEIELLRNKLYDELLYWLYYSLPSLKYKEISHLLLRYIFNKNITKHETDDSVFIVTKSVVAETQFKKDMEYHKLNIDTDTIIQKLEQKIYQCKKQLDKQRYHKKDERCYILNGQIKYNNRLYKDVLHLAEKNPDKIPFILALNLRYTYMKLMNHGLARDYKSLGYDKTNVLEAFATPFNRYFNTYCSAFYDLECHLGSLGSFFNIDLKEIQLKYPDIHTVSINPPFDDSLISMSIDKVIEYLKYKEDAEVPNTLQFLLTIPDWKEFACMENVIQSKWCKEVRRYKKGELVFIDYMSGKQIYPCDIVEIVLK